MYVSRFKRFLGYFIDCLLIGTISSVLLKIINLNLYYFLVSATLSYCVIIFYFVLQESSKWQATLGKMLFNISVVDLNYKKISLGKSFYRTFLYSIPMLPFLILNFYIQLLIVESNANVVGDEVNISPFVYMFVEMIVWGIAGIILQFIWFLPIFFRKDRKCMHDIISSTLVTNNPKYEIRGHHKEV